MRRKKEKSYYFDVDVKWSNIIHATGMKEAIAQLKQSYIDEHNLLLEDNEIKFTKRFKEKRKF